MVEMTNKQTIAVQNSIMEFILSEDRNVSFEEYKNAEDGTFTICEEYENYSKDAILNIVADKLYEFKAHLRAMSEAE